MVEPPYTLPSVYGPGSSGTFRCVRFNQWGIGFASVTARPQYPNGAILRSTDRGSSWNEVQVNTDTHQPHIYGEDITFKDSLTGWLCSAASTQTGLVNNEGGTGGVIYMTTDGGGSWFNIYSEYGIFTPIAIFYSPLSHRLFVSLWSGVEGFLLVSADDGKTFTTPATGDVIQGKLNGFCAIDSIILINQLGGPVVRSSDAGLSWNGVYPITYPQPHGVESWQPYADTRRKIFYIAPDLNLTLGTGFHRSTDLGLSWQRVSLFDCIIYGSNNGLAQHGCTNGCTTGDTAGNVYVQKITEGIWCSSDSGSTWRSICGPSNNVDTRAFTVFDNTLFSGSPDGIWALKLNQPPRIVFDSGFFIAGSKCNTVNKSFSVLSTYACSGNVTLDSVSIEGSSAFKAQPDSNQRLGIGGSDSIVVAYIPEHQYDTAHLIFHFVENGFKHDTSVTLYGFVGAPVALSFSLKPQTVDVSSGDTVDIPVYISGADTLLGKITANISLALDGDMLEAVKFIPILSGVSLAGSLAYSNGNETIPLEINNLRLYGETLVGTLRCVAYVSHTLQTSVSLSTVSMSSGDPRCLTLLSSPEVIHVNLIGCGDSVLRDFLQTKHPLRIVSIRPNPTEGNITLDLFFEPPASPNIWNNQATIEIVNLIGEKAFSEKIVLRAGTNSLSISNNTLSGGMYLIRVRAAGAVVSGSFLKQ